MLERQITGMMANRGKEELLLILEVLVSVTFQKFMYLQKAKLLSPNSETI